MEVEGRRKTSKKGGDAATEGREEERRKARKIRAEGRQGPRSIVGVGKEGEWESTGTT